MIEKRLYSPAEAAQALGLSRSSVYRLITARRVRTVVVGQRLRVPVDEVERITAEGAPSVATTTR